MKFKTKETSQRTQCLLVDAETNGNIVSLQMPKEVGSQICKAVNYHDRLVERLTLTEGLLSGMVAGMDDMPETCKIISDKVVEIKQLLAEIEKD